MATVAAARSILRSTATVRSAAAKAASASRSARSPFRIPATTAPRIFRWPVELSACLDTIQPFHSVTASALMTSMLSMSRGGFGWVPEVCNDDV